VETTTRDLDGADTITVEEGLQEGESQITAYGEGGVSAHIYPDGPSVGSMDADRVKLLGFAYRYPRGEGVAYGVSDPADREETTLTAPVDLSDAPTDERLHYLTFVMPADVAVEDADSDDLAFFHETDAFVIGDNGVARRKPHEDALGDDSGDDYERQAVEGAYDFSFEGRTEGVDWSVGFYIYKSSYVEKATASRGRSRPEYVTVSMDDGFAGELAQLLSEEADENDITGKREQVEFIIDFVQNLPYVPDDVSTGFDDYTKFLTETLCEAGGDCEDTAIMLAAILQSEPFGYDMVLIQPPGHMAAGIYGTDLPGYYWTADGRKYYYIETTGVGWGIGDLPEEYQDADAYVHQV
jgi:hypothetical protein